ncbi:MAG: hypothetical protein ACK5TO_18770 [Planctomycetaceae bacterium]
MSNEQPVFEEEIQPKKGMSTTAKVVMVMLGLGGVGLLLCCGGLFGAGVWLKRTAEQAQVTNPVEVRALAGQIASIKLPESFEPQQGLQLPVVGMRMVTFYRPDRIGWTVVLMENSMGFDSSDPAQRDQMIKQIQQQENQEGNLTDTEDREIEVAGQKVSFQFGTKTIRGVTVRQVLGFVPLKKGVVMVNITGPIDDFDEDEVVAILQSIGEPGEPGVDSATGTAMGAPLAPQDPVTPPAAAGSATTETPPPVDEPVEAEQPEPAGVPQ